MKNKVLIIITSFIAFFVILASLFIGPSLNKNPVKLEDILNLISYNKSSTPSFIFNIVFNIRLPRILLSFITGATLSICGSSLQAIFRNPLADPYILGISSGAAFGAAFALAVVPWLSVHISAFIFGLLSVGICYLIARKNQNISIVSLILGGIIVNGIFTALLTLIQFISDPFKLQNIIHWTMGNLHNASWNYFSITSILTLGGIVILLLMSWRMNILALGDEEAKAIGIKPEREKSVILVAATLATSAVVSVAGIISFYGLIVPHIVRMIVGADNKNVLPLNITIGGTFLLLIDNISRCLLPQEIPISVFTLLIGAPIFIYIIRKYQTGWET